MTSRAVGCAKFGLDLSPAPSRQGKNNTKLNPETQYGTLLNEAKEFLISQEFTREEGLTSNA